jgi:hypothetical protein
MERATLQAGPLSVRAAVDRPSGYAPGELVHAAVCVSAARDATEPLSVGTVRALLGRAASSTLPRPRALRRAHATPRRACAPGACVTLYCIRATAFMPLMRALSRA